MLASLGALLDPSSGPLTAGERLVVYLTLGASPIVTEEFAPLVGGVGVAQGQLGLVPVVVALTIGGWLATALLYALGRWRGRWVRRRFPRAGTAIKPWLRAVRRRPWRAALAVRFAIGARLLLPLACGVAHLRADVYLLGSLVSSALWSAVFAVLGWWFGEAALAALDRVRAYDQYVGGVLVAAVIVGALVLRRRRKRQAATGPAPAPAARGWPAA